MTQLKSIIDINYKCLCCDKICLSIHEAINHNVYNHRNNAKFIKIYMEDKNDNTNK